MRVATGSAEPLAADRAVTDDLVTYTADTGEPALRAWYPPAHVVFGRRDATADGYDRAVQAAENLGYTTVERAVGGRAVAFTGDVLAFVLAEPADVTAPGIEARYEETMDALHAALEDCGASVQRGEPPDSFCPGTHSLQVGGGVTDASVGGKIAGLAQRVRRTVAVVAGAVVVRNAEAVTEVIDPVYDALGIPFDPNSVGSVAAAIERDDADDGAVDPAAVREEIEAALVGDRPTTPLNVRDT